MRSPVVFQLILLLVLSSLVGKAEELTIHPDQLLGLRGDDERVLQILKRPDVRLVSETTDRQLFYRKDGTRNGERTDQRNQFEILGGNLSLVIESSTRVSRSGRVKTLGPRVSKVTWTSGRKGEHEKVNVQLPAGLKLGQSSDDAKSALHAAFGRFSGDFRTANGFGYLTLNEGVMGVPITVHFAEGVVQRIVFSR